MSSDALVVRGAREHNLKNITVEIPRDSLTVITGLSGSGKSSLAFDTIYAEGQRRYVESLSAYARQFLGLMEKPDVDAIEGLSPAISIEQKSAGHNPRSTVGTITEVYDYLRLLWARLGTPHCPKDGSPIERQNASQITDLVLAWPEGTKIEVLAPVVRGRKGEFRDVFEAAKKQGFVRVRVDGETHDLSDVPKLNRRQNHDIAVVVDRLVVRRADRSRLADSIETALKAADGTVEVVRGGTSTLFSERYACPTCGLSLPELEPPQFSFNSPFGACPDCSGDRLRQRARAARGVHDRAAVPHVRRQAAASGEPVGAAARSEHRRRGGPRGDGRAGVLREHPAARERTGWPRPGHRPADPQGGERSPALPAQRRPRLPHPRPLRRLALARRAAHPGAAAAAHS